MRICILASSYQRAVETYRHELAFDPRPWLLDHECNYHLLEKSTAARETRRLAGQGFDVFINLCDGYAEEQAAGIEVVREVERCGVAFTGPDSAREALRAQVSLTVLYAEPREGERDPRVYAPIEHPAHAMLARGSRAVAGKKHRPSVAIWATMKGVVNTRRSPSGCAERLVVLGEERSRPRDTADDPQRHSRATHAPRRDLSALGLRHAGYLAHPMERSGRFRSKIDVGSIRIAHRSSPDAPGHGCPGPAPSRPMAFRGLLLSAPRRSGSRRNRRGNAHGSSSSSAPKSAPTGSSTASNGSARTRASRSAASTRR